METRARVATRAAIPRNSNHTSDFCFATTRCSSAGRVARTYPRRRRLTAVPDCAKMAACRGSRNRKRRGRAVHGSTRFQLRRRECHLFRIAVCLSWAASLALENAGLEFIVASGFEGGGHRGSFLRSPADSLKGGFSLIPQVVDAVSIPVIAAGGIADGRGLIAALALGAEAVQIGTAFLSCAGSGASKAYRAALGSHSPGRTGLTDAFTGRLARGIRNRLMDELADMDDPPLPFPLQHALTQTVGSPASAQEQADLMTLWAGQSASLRQCTEATEFMTQLIEEVDACFSKVLGGHLVTTHSADSKRG